jgi:two-component system, OmpR family, phosphate regulon sensor histidine kinase PhoR
LKSGVRLKLFAISLALVVGVGIVCGLFLERGLRSWLAARIETELLAQARVARDLMEVAPGAASVEVADGLADRMGRSTGARVTIIRNDGVVLGDSSLTEPEVRHVENHGERPEVLQAVSKGQGASTRYSTSVLTEMHYVAVPFSGAEIHGVVRVAMPLAEVDVAIGRLRVVLILAGVVGLVAAVSISGLASHLASSPLRNLVRSARLTTAGGGAAAKRLPVSSNDELGRLAGSFNELVGELDLTLKSLASERDRLETILGGMTEALLALDSDNRVTHANRAAMELLTLAESPIGDPLIEVVRVPALAELMERVHREGGAPAESELSIPPSRQVLARAASVKSTGGIILVMLDITEMRRLEKVRRDFVANVSHELRTPVSVIQANAETLLDGALTHPTRGPEFLGAILRNAHRLARLVSDLLDLSRIESGHFTLEIQPTRVASAVQRAVESIRGLAARKRLTVETAIAAELEVMADTSAFDQVLTNLIVNAVKYTPEDGHVEIRAQRGIPAQSGEPTIVIDVCDDGTGIEPRHRVRIFERFYRVDPGRSRDMGGTGLGLSIVKHLVGAMRGEVGVTDNPTGGSVFRVILPAVPT